MKSVKTRNLFQICENNSINITLLISVNKEA